MKEQNGQETHSPIKKDILLRVHTLYLTFILFAAVILVRMIYVQFFSHEIAVNAERIEQRITRIDTAYARRGSILARNGEPLAASIFRYRVTVDFSAPGFDSLKLFDTQMDTLAELLAGYFKDRPAKQYADWFKAEHRKQYRLTNPRRVEDSTVSFWVRWIDRLTGAPQRTVLVYDTLREHRPVNILPREIDYAEWQELSKWPVLNGRMGMVSLLDKLDRRIYPQGELARRTIGLRTTGRQDNSNNYGIEYVFRDTLEGKNGRYVRRRIARGFAGRVPDDKRNIDPEAGWDVVTTLDPEVQDIASRALLRQLERQHALWGTTLVMECATGDLLAMVNLGRNPQNPESRYTERENYAIGRRMEPGSTLKLASLLALVEERGSDLSLTYDTGNGAPVTVGRAKVQDSHGGFHEVDLKTATAQSLNVFYARAIYEAYKDEPQRYVDFLKHLRLHEPVGFEAFGEKRPIVPEPGSKIWYPHVTLPNMGYGYAVELTPLQVLTLYNAVANDGRMVAPRLITEIRRGREVLRENPVQVRVERICSKESLRKVRECLEEVGRTGTAKYYFGDTTRVTVGAKTGTAKFAQGGIRYSDGYYLGTMVTYLPADRPRYTVLTSLFTRRGYGTTYYGAGLAGPVVKEVAGYLYNHSTDRFSVVERTRGDARRYPRSIKGGDVEQLREVTGELSRKVDRGARSGWGRVSVDSLDCARIDATETPRDRMPDVRGMGLKDALFLLESRGLRVVIQGRGAVVRQSIAPGTPLQRGQTAALTLK